MTGYRILLALVVGGALSLPLAAQTSLQPRVEIGTAALWGTAFEYVLRNGTYEDPISRLTWPVPLGAALSLTAELPWTSWTSTTVALVGAAPSQGTMIDEDWNAGSLKYGRSEHEAYAMAHGTARAEQAFRWGPLSVSAGGIYRWMSWEGWNGTGTYTDNSGSKDTLTFSGLLIAYRQQWYIPYGGASWTQSFADWSVTPGLRFGPYVWGSHMDNHNYAGNSKEDLDFLDQVWGGSYLQGALETAWTPAPNWTWGLRLEGELTWGAIGETLLTYSYQSYGGAIMDYSTTLEKPGAWFREVSLIAFVRN